MNLPSNHYQTLQIADGVFALINQPQGWGIGNMGIIDLGDKTLLFDSSMTPTSALEAKRIAEQATGRAVDLVLNSHYHNDHIWGNQVFSDQTQIISSTKTRCLIQTKGVEECSYFLSNSSRRLREVTNQFEDEEDEEAKADLSKLITYYEAIVESIPLIIIRSPNLTFNERLTFHGPKRSAEVITFQNGHTGDDAIIFLPEDGIIFMADLLFVKSHPYLGEAEPDSLVSILDEISGYAAEIFVSGHGTIGSKEDLALLKEYVQSCQTLVSQYIQSYLPSNSIEEIPIPTKFESWQLRNFFYINLRHLMSKFQD